MTREEFWKLTDQIHTEANADMDRKCASLERELRKLGPEETTAWYNHYNALRHEAYTWDLWAVAYIYEGGCSDDMFLDFRSTLVSCGQAVFHQALSDPDSLEKVFTGWDMFYEGYQYVAPELHESLTGHGISCPPFAPSSPAGTPWTDEDLPQRFPRIFAAFWEGD
jgi:hypothetical protein